MYKVARENSKCLSGNKCSSPPDRGSVRDLCMVRYENPRFYHFFVSVKSLRPRPPVIIVVAEEVKLEATSDGRGR